jgi:hypothetical protein
VKIFITLLFFIPVFSLGGQVNILGVKVNTIPQQYNHHRMNEIQPTLKYFSEKGFPVPEIIINTAIFFQIDLILSDPDTDLNDYYKYAVQRKPYRALSAAENTTTINFKYCRPLEGIYNKNRIPFEEFGNGLFYLNNINGITDNDFKQITSKLNSLEETDLDPFFYAISSIVSDLFPEKSQTDRQFTNYFIQTAICDPENKNNQYIISSNTLDILKKINVSELNPQDHGQIEGENEKNSEIITDIETASEDR